MTTDFDIIIEQANSAILSRDYQFAEKILLSQLKKIDDSDEEHKIILKMNLANLYLRSNNLDKSLDIYKELNAIKPNDVNILNGLGVVYRKLCLFDKSIEALKEAKGLNEKKETTLYNLGNTYKQTGDYQNSINCFLEVLEINPDDALAHNHLGMVHFLCKNYDEAIEAYKAGLKLDPNHPFLNFNLAEVFRTQEAFDEAIIFYQGALKTKPNWITALKAMAECYLKINNIEKAIEIYKTITDTSAEENNELYTAKLAELYELNNQEEEAKKYYEQALKINKYFLPAILNYAKMLNKQKNYLKAYKILSDGQEKNQTNKELLLNLFDTGLMLEDYTESKKNINLLINMWKEDFEVLKRHGMFFCATGESQKAELIFEKILRTSPEKIGLRLEAAEVYIHNNKLENAADEFVKYLNKQPLDIAARLKLGKVYSNMQTFDKAKNEYEKIIKQDPKNIEAISAIAELNKEKGNAEEAVRLANQAIDIQTESDEETQPDGLANSLQLYEEAVEDYGEEFDIERNLDKLNQPEETAELVLQLPQEKNVTEEETEIDISTEIEKIPDLEMPFDDLMELADDEHLEAENKNDNRIDDMVSFDVPIDDMPENHNTGNAAIQLPGKYDKPSGGYVHDEEFQLPQVTDTPEQNNEVLNNSKNAPVSTLDDLYANDEREIDLDKNYKSDKPQPQTILEADTAQEKFSPENLQNDNNIPDENYSDTENKKSDKVITEDNNLIMEKEEKSAPEDIDKTKNAALGLLKKIKDAVDNFENKLDNAYENVEEEQQEIPKTETEPLSPETLPNNISTESSDTISENENDGYLQQNTPSLYANAFPHSLKNSPEFEQTLEVIPPVEILKLFSYLRDLMNNLPPDDSKNFLISNERIQMEYVIDKLSGDLGLKNRIVFMNFKSTLQKAMEPKNLTEERIKDTLSYLRNIATQLPDKGFASAFVHKINNIIPKIDDTKQI